MKSINFGTKAAAAIIADQNRAGYADIFEAYDRPSRAKVEIWEEIRERAYNTPGYIPGSLRIASRSGFIFTTIYSYKTEAGDTVIVKDTKADTYTVTIPALRAIEGQKEEADSLTA